MGLASDLFTETPELEKPKLQSVESLYSDPKAQEEDRLKFIMDSSIDENPERAKRSIEIQQKTGIPKKFIDDNFDEIDKTARQAEFNSRDYLKKSPKVADWLLRNPDYAPLLREDGDSMTSLEEVLRVAENTVRAVGAAPTTSAPA